MPVFKTESMIQYPSLIKTKTPPNEPLKKLDFSIQNYPKFQEKIRDLEVREEKEVEIEKFQASHEDLLVVGDNENEDTKDHEESEEEIKKGEEEENGEEDSEFITNNLLPEFQRLSQSLSDLSAQSNLKYGELG